MVANCGVSDRRPGGDRPSRGADCGVPGPGERPGVEVDRVFPPAGPPAGGGATALVVDPDPDTRAILCAALRFNGYRIVTGGTGDEVVALAVESRPCVIIMEVRFPGMDGLRALKALRSHLQTRTTPIIVLTTHADQETAVAARAAGCSIFLTKPCRASEVMGAVTGLVP